MSRWILLLLASCVLTIGCGPKAQLKGDAKNETALETVKTVLTELSESGAMGSGVGKLMAALEEYKAVDAAKAEELRKDAQSMMSASSPDAVKAKAKEMLGKL